MAQLIYDSVLQYFANELGPFEINSEQRQSTDNFLCNPQVATLVIRRDDRSANALSFACSGQLQGSSGDALVFIKSGIQGPPQTTSSTSNDEAIIIDSQLIANLREKLEDSFTTNTGLLNVLSLMRKYAKMDNVMGAMKKDRSELLTRVLDWAEECVTMEHKENKDIVDKISALRAREGKIRAVIKVCDSLCGDIDGYSGCKKTLEQLAREVGDEGQRLFKQWCTSCDQISLDKRMQCIEIDASSQTPRVTFDPKLVRLAKDCRLLRCIAFNIPQAVAVKEADVIRYGSIARELKEIVNFYCTVGDQILLSQKPMLIEAAKAFTSLLESKDRISWDKEPLKLRAWLDELRDFARAFSSENRFLRHRHHIILQILVPLFDYQPGKWRQQLSEVRTMVAEVDQKYSNTLPWKMHWDHQLYKLLEYHFHDALLRSDNWLGFGHTAGFGAGASSAHSANSSSKSSEIYYVDLCFVSGQVAFRPNLEEIKAKIYMRLKKFLLTPVQFQGFVQLAPDEEPIFSAIYMRSFFSFPLLYSKAAEIVKELKTVSETFQEWTAFYYVIQKHGNSFATMSEFLRLATLDDYKSNLALLKSKTQKFHKTFLENEIRCQSANIVVNLVPIKNFVDWLLNEMDKLLVRILKETTEAESRELTVECGRLLERASKPPKKVAELAELETLLRKEMSQRQAEWSAKHLDIVARAAFLKKWSSNLAPNIAVLNEQFDEFENIYESRESLLDTFKEMIKSRTG